MESTLFNWLLDLIKEFSKFGTWLTTPLDYINMPPLALFGFTGLTALIVWHLVRLIVGG